MQASDVSFLILSKKLMALLPMLLANLYRKGKTPTSAQAELAGVEGVFSDISFIKLTRDLHADRILSKCALKEICRSRMTPTILTVFLFGMAVPLAVIGFFDGWCFELQMWSVVHMVAEILKPTLFVH